MAQTFQLDTAIERLIEMLQHENALLKKGEITEIGALTEDKQTLATILTNAVESPSQREFLKPYFQHLAKIKQLAEENERLLKAAKTGVNSAKTRLNNIMMQDQTVGTYTNDGDKLKTQQAGVTKTVFA